MSTEFSNFVEFLQNPSIIHLAMAAVLSDRMSDVANGLFEHLIEPFFNIDMDKNGVGDGHEILNKIKDKKLKFKGVEIKIGSFILSIVRFFIVAYSLYIMSNIMTKKK